jgi:hypothetical protein
MRKLIFFCLPLVFASCISNAKLERLCNERFPSLDSTVVKTVVETKYDTTYMNPAPPDTVTIQTRCPPSDTASVVNQKIPCPPCAAAKVVYKTQNITKDSVRLVIRKINAPSEKPKSYLWYLVGSLMLNAFLIYLLIKFK